jgi:flavodoxin
MVNMKKLVAYYSFEGNTKFLAEAIAEEIKADLLELKPVKEIKTKGFFKYPIGGAQVVFGIKPKLQPYDLNPEDYDIIFLGTPTWSLSYSPTMRSFLSNAKLKNKKIGLFCCRIGKKGKTFKVMKKKLEGNDIIGEIDFSEPLKKGKEKDQEVIKKWAKELIKNK